MGIRKGRGRQSFPSVAVEARLSRPLRISFMIPSIRWAYTEVWIIRLGALVVSADSDGGSLGVPPGAMTRCLPFLTRVIFSSRETEVTDMMEPLLLMLAACSP